MKTRGYDLLEQHKVET